MAEYLVNQDVRIGAAYGIAGLKRYDEEDADDWLDMFGTVSEKLTSRDYSSDSDLVEQMEDLHQYAQEIKGTPVDERPSEFPENEVETAIDEAEALYDSLVTPQD